MKQKKKLEDLSYSYENYSAKETIFESQQLQDERSPTIRIKTNEEIPMITAKEHVPPNKSLDDHHYQNIPQGRFQNSVACILQ